MPFKKKQGSASQDTKRPKKLSDEEIISDDDKDSFLSTGEVGNVDSEIEVNKRAISDQVRYTEQISDNKEHENRENEDIQEKKRSKIITEGDIIEKNNMNECIMEETNSVEGKSLIQQNYKNGVKIDVEFVYNENEKMNSNRKKDNQHENKENYVQLDNNSENMPVESVEKEYHELTHNKAEEFQNKEGGLSLDNNPKKEQVKAKSEENNVPRDNNSKKKANTSEIKEDDNSDSEPLQSKTVEDNVQAVKDLEDKSKNSGIIEDENLDSEPLQSKTVEDNVQAVKDLEDKSKNSEIIEDDNLDSEPLQSKIVEDNLQAVKDLEKEQSIFEDAQGDVTQGDGTQKNCLQSKNNEDALPLDNNLEEKQSQSKKKEKEILEKDIQGEEDDVSFKDDSEKNNSINGTNQGNDRADALPTNFSFDSKNNLMGCVTTNKETLESKEHLSKSEHSAKTCQVEKATDPVQLKNFLNSFHNPKKNNNIFDAMIKKSTSTKESKSPFIVSKESGVIDENLSVPEKLLFSAMHNLFKFNDGKWERVVQGSLYLTLHQGKLRISLYTTFRFIVLVDLIVNFDLKEEKIENRVIFYIPQKGFYCCTFEKESERNKMFEIIQKYKNL